jgi:membrane-associated protease RseP (regulator of RpoE activity)
VYGLLILLGLIASINIFIGIFNLVPLPPLDGGHLAVLGIERSVNAYRKARGQDAGLQRRPTCGRRGGDPGPRGARHGSSRCCWLDITDPLQLPF